jgi:hypothetical protein
MFTPIIFNEENQEAKNALLTGQQQLQQQLTNIFSQLEQNFTLQVAIPISNQTSASTEQEDFLPTGTNCCITNFDISKQIPFWVIIEKEERGGNEITIFDFIQKYYDWLYCDLECGSGSNYLLEDKFLQVIDIEKTKERFVKRLYSTYFPEYRSTETLLDKDGDPVTIESLSSFVKSIKTRFYLKKGTAEALGIFFNKIFSIDQVSIKYPKKQILRLNGGAFYDSRFKFNAVTADRTLDPEAVANEIVGSRLNYNRFQDGNVFTDYSYILGVSGGASAEYKNLYLRTNHPAGTNCIFELNVINYQPPGSTLEHFALCEIPKLKNYYPYVLNQVYVPNNPLGSFYGITYTVGCSLENTENSIFGEEPTHFFPNWGEDMNEYTNFFHIPLNKLFLICRINNSINPNNSIPQTCP